MSTRGSFSEMLAIRDRIDDARAKMDATRNPAARTRLFDYITTLMGDLIENQGGRRPDANGDGGSGPDENGGGGSGPAAIPAPKGASVRAYQWRDDLAGAGVLYLTGRTATIADATGSSTPISRPDAVNLIREIRSFGVRMVRAVVS